MRDMTLMTINRKLHKQINAAEKLDTGNDFEKEVQKIRLVGYLCSVATQNRKSDVEERTEYLEKLLKAQEKAKEGVA